MKNLDEWIVKIAVAVISFFGVRGGYIILVKELSVGKTAIKSAKARIKVLEEDRDRLVTEKLRLANENDDLKRRFSRVEKEADEQYDEMKSMRQSIIELKQLYGKQISI